MVFDSAGTLLYTYRVAKDIQNNRVIEGVETTTLTCSEKGRALILLYVNSREIMKANPEMLLSEYLKEKKINFGGAKKCAGCYLNSKFAAALYQQT